VAEAFNDVVDLNEAMAQELARLRQTVGEQGKLVFGAASPAGVRAVRAPRPPGTAAPAGAGRGALRAAASLRTTVPRPRLGNDLGPARVVEAGADCSCGPRRLLSPAGRFLVSGVIRLVMVYPLCATSSLRDRHSDCLGGLRCSAVAARIWAAISPRQRRNLCVFGSCAWSRSRSP
jgi:hypothetical protein